VTEYLDFGTKYMENGVKFFILKLTYSVHYYSGTSSYAENILVCSTLVRILEQEINFFSHMKH
jgi:hypothetical protein